MANFEEVGRRIDRELAKVRRYLKEDMQPAAEKRAVAALRKAARVLENAAKELESRLARAK